mmetsp:Transcript_5378/g.7031  ORF Transcript_5378/g.7031 Transcript_5378/m.7031 type:complete len:127 (-) Transcript_5378:366-746(-)
MKGKTLYLPPRFMSVNTAAEQLLEAEEITHKNNIYNGSKTLCVGLARMGQETQQIVAGTLNELKNVDFGSPLHSLIICGELHDLELEVLKEYLIEGSTYQSDDGEVSSRENININNEQAEESQVGS